MLPDDIRDKTVTLSLFFAEVLGISLTQNFSEEVLQEITDAFAEHSALLFRNQEFNDVSRINFKNFSSLVITGHHALSSGLIG